MDQKTRWPPASWIHCILFLIDDCRVFVFVCVGGSPSLKWLFSIISRVSSGVSVRVPSGL